jgi:hypothetical protein
VLALQSISKLKAIGLRPNCEVLTRKGYGLDAIVEVDGKPIGRGQPAVSFCQQKRLTGNAALKCRQVTSLEDILIVSVPYWEWNELKNDHVV